MSVSHSSPPTSPITVILDAEKGRDAWRGAVEDHIDLPPFLHPGFLEGLERIVPWKRLFVHAPGTGSASLFLRKRGPIQDIVLPPFCPFSALLMSGSSVGSADVGSLLLPSPGLPPTRLFSLHPGQKPDILGIAPSSGFEELERFTYHLPTASLEQAIAGWSSSQRRSFRKHEKDYAFSVVDQGDLARSPSLVRSDLKAVISLAAAGYARHGARFPLEKAGLESLSEDLIRMGLGRLHVLKASGTVQAGVLALSHTQMAWYWLAGSTPGPAMTVLLGHLQDALHRAEIPVLDLMGANTPGIAEFKRRFGGSLVSYLHVRTSTLPGRVADAAARHFQRLRR